jgi:YwiC-like protein
MAMKIQAAEVSKSWLPHFSKVVGTKSADIAQSEIEALIAEEDSTAKARRERRRALIVPREHGAWGLLLVPMITGAGIAFRESSNLFPFLLLLTAALTLFWLRTPLESYLGTSAVKAQTTEERRDVLFAVIYLAAIAGLAVAMLLRNGANPLLWWIGSATGIAFAGQALLKKLGRKARMLSEMVGTVGLTASAPAAYYVVTGKFGDTGWMLWLANLLFAGNQIHYVQLRIHTAKVEGLREKLARGWIFATGQILMAAILIALCVIRVMPWLALIAFLPLIFRGFLYFFQKPGALVVRRLGWNELAQAVAFCILFVVTI